MTTPHVDDEDRINPFLDIRIDREIETPINLRTVDFTEVAPGRIEILKPTSRKIGSSFEVTYRFQITPEATP